MNIFDDVIYRINIANKSVKSLTLVNFISVAEVRNKNRIICACLDIIYLLDLKLNILIELKYDINNILYVSPGSDYCYLYNNGIHEIDIYNDIINICQVDKVKDYNNNKIMRHMKGNNIINKSYKLYVEYCIGFIDNDIVKLLIWIIITLLESIILLK